MSPPSRRLEFEPRFEGAEVLTQLLELAGCPYSAEEVGEAMQAARQGGSAAGDFIPQLFEEEPRFPDPEVARRLYQNLFGLWELAGQEGPLRLSPAAPPRPVRPKKRPAPSKPAPFGIEGPDEAFVEEAWRYLEELDGRERERLEHSFENRHDALLGDLDAQGLTDDGYASARQLLFELFAMIELGWPPGLSNVAPGVPRALVAYSEDALSEAELEESEKVRDAVMKGLGVLWSSRRRRR